MQKVQMQIEVPAGMKAAGDLLVALAADIKAKKSVGDMLADLGPKLTSAIALAGELGEDVKDEEAKIYAGVLAGQLAEALTAPAAPAATPA